MNRRSFFGVVAGLAAMPILAKLPAPMVAPIRRVGAWAEAKIVGGAITSITITNSGAGYYSPVVSISSKDHQS